MENINYLAVLLCALFNLILGGIWYSPILFQKLWAREAGLNMESYKPNPAKTYGFAFVFAFLASFGMASFLAGSGQDWQQGMFAGFMTGLTLSATLFAIVALFELRSWKYILIHSGFMIVYFTVVGAILTAWT